MEKKESPNGERAVKPVILLPSKKWVLKFGFLKVQIGNKCLKAKIKKSCRVWNFKNTMLKKRRRKRKREKKSHKSYKKYI